MAPWEELTIDPRRISWADELRDTQDDRRTRLAIVHDLLCIFDRHFNEDGSMGGFVCRGLASVEDTYLSPDVIVGPFVDLIRCRFDGPITIGGSPERHAVYMVHCAARGRLLFQGDDRTYEACKQSYDNHDPFLYWV